MLVGLLSPPLAQACSLCQFKIQNSKFAHCPRWRKLVACAQFTILPNSQSKILPPVSPPLAQACSLCPIHNPKFSHQSHPSYQFHTLANFQSLPKFFYPPQFIIHNSKFIIQNSPSPLSINILSITCSVILQSSKKLWGRGNKFGKNLQSNRLVATIRLQLTY